MAPYISSHLCDSVWLAPSTIGAQLDILQNLVANTRAIQSAAVTLVGDLLPIGGGLRPAGFKTSASQMAVCSVVDPGWSYSWTVALAEWRPSKASMIRLITRTSDLSAWTVV